MIKESYCSYETSKLLKEKGFEGEAYSWYDISKQIQTYDSPYLKEPYYEYVDTYIRPSLSVAMRWLREEKGIYLSVRLNGFAESKDEVGGYWWFVDIFDANKGEWIDNGINNNSYEEVVENAILYILKNLI